jgi:hypothetical protein
MDGQKMHYGASALGLPDVQEKDSEREDGPCHGFKQVLQLLEKKPQVS